MDKSEAILSTVPVMAATMAEVKIETFFYLLCHFESGRWIQDDHTLFSMQVLAVATIAVETMIEAVVGTIAVATIITTIAVAGTTGVVVITRAVAAAVVAVAVVATTTAWKHNVIPFSYRTYRAA